MALLLLALTLLLHHAHAVPYAVTEYYQVLTITEKEGEVRDGYTIRPILDTTTQFITPTATALPSPLTVKTSTPEFDLTFVKVHLPTGAGNPIPTQSTGSTVLVVPITYSSCTTYSSGNDYAIPPVTSSAHLYITPPVVATMSAVYVTHTEEYNSYRSGTSTIAIMHVDPAAIDPVQFASLSHGYQPHSCLTASARVDYRHACDAGPTYRMKGAGCGELNPCCFDCWEYEWRCFTGHCTEHIPGETFHRCANGVDYYGGSVTSVDEKYTQPLPKKTKGDWSGVKTTGGNPNEPTSTQSGGASRLDGGVVWGYLLLFTAWAFMT